MAADVRQTILKIAADALKSSAASPPPAPAKQPRLSTGRAIVLGAGLMAAGQALVSSRGREMIGTVRERLDEAVPADGRDREDEDFDDEDFDDQDEEDLDAEGEEDFDDQDEEDLDAEGEEDFDDDEEDLDAEGEEDFEDEDEDEDEDEEPVRRRRGSRSRA